ncbi:hypothetical protein GCM10007320_20720 [Pseudorhodoferax aquiterrae]|uniref:Lipopolysaccharide biosynthesis protein n=1 Tax=Pseudorhodoferax aquiterrae TaxID=747304 RepID=A0ABQ3G0F0_9BURK|nr:lipopolysaccharide biosynthesis protein [Pseudorhodoferax aquiterrae]GHC79653.1 hypothetical protein GCM10007320_20720 [Pseudorhodoferax aquiterrae]
MSRNTELSGQVARGMLWVAIEKWGTRLMSLAVFSILGRLLTPAEFGLAALAMSISAILAVFVENGMAQALVQKKEVDEEEIHSAFWTSLAIAVGLYLLLVLCAPLLAQLFKQPQLESIIPVSALVLPIAAFSSVPAAFLERTFNFSKLARRQLGGALVGTAVAVYLALTGEGVWAIVMQPVAASAAGAMILWFSAKWHPRLVYSVRAIRGMWKFSAQVVGIELLNTVQANIDKLLIGAFFPPAALGYYYVGQRILNIVMDVISSTLAKVSLTTFSRLQEQHARLMHYFLTLTFASATLAVAIFSVLVVFGHPLIELFFGTGWGASVPLMAMMAPSAMLASVTLFDKSLLLATGNGTASLKVAVAQVVFGTVVLVAAIPFGVTAVAAARSVRQIAFWPVRIITLHKNARLPYVTYLKQFAGPALAGIAVPLVGYGLQQTPWANAPFSTVTFLLPAIGLTFACYALVIWLAARHQVRQISTTLKEIWLKRRGAAALP